MKNLAIIPARSGSKGLKDKNIRRLDGKALIAYTIEAAINSKVFNKVMVSTDSQIYKKIAESYGAEVPFLRSSENSGDYSSSWDTVIEVLNFYRNRGVLFDSICLLQPTSPLRDSKDIIRAYNIYEQANVDSVTSVCELEHPIEFCKLVDENMNLHNLMVREKDDDYRRQDLKKVYRLNGAIYIRKIIYDNHISLGNHNEKGLIMNLLNSIDIDNSDDFQLAEFIMKNKK